MPISDDAKEKGMKDKSKRRGGCMMYATFMTEVLISLVKRNSM